VNIRQNALGNMNPSSELISEFKVTQFNNNAEFAQIGDVTISTKSGGDQFHGSAFEYLQNDALDAEFWNFGNKPHKAFNTVPGPSRMLSKTFHLTERMRLRFKKHLHQLIQPPEFRHASDKRDFLMLGHRSKRPNRGE
jgi:hypothetical protein